MTGHDLVNWSSEQYHADREHVSKHWLDFIDRSPAHLKAYFDGLISGTKRMEFGQLLHSWVLEPDSIHTRYLKHRKFDRRYKDQKAAALEWEQRAAEANLKLIDEETWHQLTIITDAVYHHKAAAAILRKGAPEQSVLWVNPETGEKCKARADWLRDSFITDVKITADARPTEFARSIVRYRYHVQDAHYREGFERKRFALIAVETEPPYGVAVYVDNERMYGIGKRHRDANLRTLVECKARNEWPAYPEEIQSIELPRWVT